MAASERKFALAATLIFLLAVALRIPTLGRVFWLDEAYTAWFSALPLRELWTDVPTYETHPPAYYTIIHLWRGVAGSSEIALRLPSLVASLATVLLLIFSGRLIGARKMDGIALLAALLFAFNGTQVSMAQSARPYALQTLAASTAILMAVYLLRSWQRPETLPGAGRRQFAATVVLALAAGLTLWLHNTSLFITLSIWAGLLLASAIFVRQRLFRIGILLLVAGLAALLIWSPFLREFIAQSTNMSTMHFWLTFHWWMVAELPYGLTGGMSTAIPVTMLVLVGIYFLCKRSEQAVVVLIVVIVMLPPALLVCVSLVKQPVFMPRLLFWSGPTIMYLAACGIAALPYPRARIVAVAACLILMASDLRAYYGSIEENWRGILQTASTHAAPGDLFLALPNEVEVVLAYYQQDYPDIRNIVYLPGPFPFRQPDRIYVGNLAAPQLESRDMERIRTATADHQRIWLLTRGEDLYDADGMVRTYLGQTRKATEYWNDGLIRLELFQ